MKLKIIILICMMLMLVPVAFAIPPTTYATLSNGSYETDISRYHICYGQLEGSDTSFGAFNNEVEFHQDIDGGSTLDAGVHSVNLTTAQENSDQRFGNLTNASFPSDVCIDIQGRFQTESSGGIAVGAVSGITTGTVGCTVSARDGFACLGLMDDASQELALWSADDATHWRSTGYTVSVGETLNMTLCINDSKAVAFLFNSDTYIVESSLANMAESLNFSLESNIGPGSAVQLDINYYCVYPKTGAPVKEPEVDSTDPTFGATSINDTAPKRTEVVGLSIVVDDETALSGYKFAHNLSGDFVNSSEFPISGTSINASFNLTVTSTRQHTVGYQWWVDDATGNSAVSSIATFLVANTAPETPTILFPTAGLITFLQPLEINVTFPADLDVDSITINYYIDDVLNQTSATNVTLNVSDATYSLAISLFDGVEYSANATRTFTIDTINPIITVNAPTNNSLHNSNIAVNLTCTNINLQNLSYIFHNSTDIVQTEFNASAGITESTLFTPISVAGVGDGSYNMNISCTDNATITTSGFLILQLDQTNPTVTATEISKTGVVAGDAVQVNGTCNDANLNQISIENNATGSFSSVATATTSDTELKFIHNHTAVVGFISHRFVCTDDFTNAITSGVLNYTGNESPDSAPNTTLITPANNTIQSSTSASVDFDCSAVDDNALVNISLFHNLSGTFELIETNSVSGISASTEFTDTITFNNTIVWNCRAVDNSSQTSFAPGNFILATNQTVAPPSLITGLVTFPLENAGSLVGVFALFVIILGVLGFKFRKSKK